MNITTELYGKMPDGKDVSLFTLTNGVTRVKITNYGGTITELWVPDRQGMSGDIVLGYERLEDYLRSSPYFGCIVGRYANRIAKGRFTLDGVEYSLSTNDGPNHLHGGIKGFDKVVWEAATTRGHDSVSLILKYSSRDGEEGYPGNLDATVIYTLDAHDRLTVSYEATTDKPTIVNLSHHSYFNLAGAGNILGHHLTINAKRYTPVDETLIPTGALGPVEGTPMDFLTPQIVGARIGEVPGGYDHNYVLDREGSGLELAARVTEEQNGRTLEIWTTEPGIQFYSGNFLDGSLSGKGGQKYEKHFGCCLEPQHYPDSPNRPEWPTSVLRPGEKYQSQTVFHFGVIGE
ncbi:MAG: galactose mutarotase [Ignavibacteria bacterium]|nr:galactose mutarotase [Ignavibacteria bacterium]